MLVSILKRECAFLVLILTTVRKVENIKVRYYFGLFESLIKVFFFAGPQDEVGCEVRPNTKLQNALCYTLDGDHINVLNILSQKLEEPWVPFRNNRKPLLHLACEKGAWRCVQHLVVTRSDEINLIKDEYYPIHQVKSAIPI